MNYFKFLYERYKKRSIIRKLIDDYEDLKESVIYSEMNSVNFIEFQNETVINSNFEWGVCNLAHWKYDKHIDSTIWVKRHIVVIKTDRITSIGFWCLPLAVCANYEELHENIQRRIDILYTELKNPKI